MPLTDAYTDTDEYYIQILVTKTILFLNSHIKKCFVWLLQYHVFLCIIFGFIGPFFSV